MTSTMPVDSHHQRSGDILCRRRASEGGPKLSLFCLLLSCATLSTALPHSAPLPPAATAASLGSLATSAFNSSNSSIALSNSSATVAVGGQNESSAALRTGLLERGPEADHELTNVVQDPDREFHSFDHLHISSTHSSTTQSSQHSSDNATDEVDAESPLQVRATNNQSSTPTPRTSLASVNVRLVDAASAGRGSGLNSDLNPQEDPTIRPIGTDVPRRAANNKCKLVRRVVVFKMKPGCVEYYSSQNYYRMELKVCGGSCHSEAALYALPVTMGDQASYELRDFYKPKCKCCKEKSRQLKMKIWMKCKRERKPRVLNAYESVSCGCKRCR